MSTYHNCNARTLVGVLLALWDAEGGMSPVIIAFAKADPQALIEQLACDYGVATDAEYKGNEKRGNHVGSAVGSTTRKNCNGYHMAQAVFFMCTEGMRVDPAIDFACVQPTAFIESIYKSMEMEVPTAPKPKRKRPSKRAVNLIMEDDGGQKVPAIKLVRSLTGMGLAEAKRAVESGCLKIYSNTNRIRPRDGVQIDCPRTGEVMTEKVASELLKAMQKAWGEQISVRADDNFPTMRMVPAM